MQKFGQFYVIYRNIVQFDYKLWKLDYFEKSVLELMADPVPCTIITYSDTHSLTITEVGLFLCYNVYTMVGVDSISHSWRHRDIENHRRGVRGAESVRIAKSVRIGKLQNRKVFELDNVQIGKCQNS